MERSETLISIWNGEFPNYTLTVSDLKKPHAMIGACLHMFQRLGIDVEAILTPPPEEERNENTIYYWDLLPVINVTRVINHMVSVLQHADKLSFTFPLPITHFLQPDAAASHSILLLLVNLMAFNENRLREIAPQVAELFRKRDQVKELEYNKKSLIDALNKQAEEKGKRAERLERIDTEINVYSEDLQKEIEAHAKEKKVLEAFLKEDEQLKVPQEQKRAQLDAIRAKVDKMKALRVYDEEDIISQSEQAAQNVKEAEEKLESLKSSLMQKENCLKNLQKVKPNLDIANNLLTDIVQLTEKFSLLEKGDQETDVTEDELNLLHSELNRVQTQLAEVQTARSEFNAKQAEAHASRHLQKAQLQSALRDAEEKDRKNIEQTKKSLQEIQELKATTVNCEQDRAKSLEGLEQMKTGFISQLVSNEEALLRKIDEAAAKLKERLAKPRN